MSKMEKFKTTCPLDCPDSCGLIATVDEGKVVKLQGDRDHPYTNGFICNKMQRYPERLYGRQRIRYPQKRVGEKGSGRFERISWDEALQICADSLLQVKTKYGGEAILPYSYAGNMGQVNRFAGYPLFHKLGTTNLGHTICSAAASTGWKTNCGDLPGCPPENAAEAELIVAWGINIKVSNIHFWQYVRAARKKGAELLVIDPYRNQTGQAADWYLQVKPGGDVALAIGLAKRVLELNLPDDDFIQAHTSGFAAFRQYVQSCRWEDIVRESGVEQKEIKRLATLLGSTSKTFLRIGIGLTRNSKGAGAIRAITSLGAVLGLFKGGAGQGVLLTTGAFKGDAGKLTYPQLAAKPRRTVNMIQLGKALAERDNPLKALIVYNANPATVNPDAAMVRKGLLREDLFTVVHEQVMTPTAKYADILLPATTFLENHDVYTAYGHFYLQVSTPVIPPLAEALSNFDFFQALAKKMGFTDPPFQQSCEQRLADFLEDMEGIPEGTIIDNLVKGGRTCSSKSIAEGRALVSLEKKYSFVSSDVDAPALPLLFSGGEFNDPDLLTRFPLRLITPPHPNLLNSTFGDLYSEEKGELLVHPEDAARYRVVDGKEALLFNHRGTVKRVVRISEETQPGLVVAEGLFWQDADQDYGTINDLTSQKLTDMGGGATFHESLVALAPA